MILARLDMIPDLPNKQREKFLNLLEEVSKVNLEPVEADDDSPGNDDYDDPEHIVTKVAKKIPLGFDDDSPGEPNPVGNDDPGDSERSKIHKENQLRSLDDVEDSGDRICH